MGGKNNSVAAPNYPTGAAPQPRWRGTLPPSTTNRVSKPKKAKAPAYTHGYAGQGVPWSLPASWGAGGGNPQQQPTVDVATPPPEPAPQPTVAVAKPPPEPETVQTQQEIPDATEPLAPQPQQNNWDTLYKEDNPAPPAGGGTVGTEPAQATLRDDIEAAEVVEQQPAAATQQPAAATEQPLSTERPEDGRYGVGHEGKNLSEADVAHLRSQGVPIQPDGSVASADFAAWANTRGGVRPPPAAEPPAAEPPAAEPPAAEPARDMRPKQPGEDWFAYHDRVGTTEQQGNAARAAAAAAAPEAQPTLDKLFQGTETTDDAGQGAESYTPTEFVQQLSDQTPTEFFQKLSGKKQGGRPPQYGGGNGGFGGGMKQSAPPQQYGGNRPGEFAGKRGNAPQYGGGYGQQQSFYGGGDPMYGGSGGYGQPQQSFQSYGGGYRPDRPQYTGQRYGGGRGYGGGYTGQMYGGGGGYSTGNYGQRFNRAPQERQYLPGNYFPPAEQPEGGADGQYENPFLGDNYTAGSGYENPFLGANYPGAGQAAQNAQFGPGSPYYDDIIRSLGRSLPF